MNYTTTNCASTTPDNQLKNDNHYFIPARAKLFGVIELCSRIRINYFKKIFFAYSTLVVVRDEDSLAIAILLAKYRTILTLKIIEALSH